MRCGWIPVRIRPQVSIIIPALNVEDTLERTLLSVARQEAIEFEVILVNDGSSDGTGNIIDRWAANDRRFQAIQGEHGGVSIARNLGVAAARADWCLFLDADDVLDPGHLTGLLSRAKLDPDACVVFGGWQKTYQSGKRGPLCRRDMADPFAVAARMCPFAIHSAIVRRAMILEVGGFEPGRAIGEDWDLWQRIARSGGTFVPAPHIVAMITVRSGSASADPQKLFDAGREVIRRGHAPDARVPNAPAEYAQGRPRSEQVAAELYHYAYCGANAVARNLPFAPWTADSDAPAVALIDAASMAETLLVGLNDAAGDFFATSSNWQALRPEVERLLSWSEPYTAPPLLRDRVLRIMDRAIAERHDAAEIAHVGRLLVAPVDLDRPLEAISIPGDTDLTVLRLRRGAERVGTICSLAIGSTLTIGQIAEQLRLEGVDPPPSRRSMVRRLAERLRSHLATRRSKDVPIGDQEAHAEAASVSAPENFDAEYWETLFSAEDPWLYENAYEQLKYLQTLAALPAGRIDQALELACAEGHFTVHLAGRVRHLIATDISSKALERAAARCADADNVHFERLDLLEGELPNGLDLIVCSEVLYYLQDRAALAKLSAKIASALKPGGALVMTHADLLVDGGLSGFDWPHLFGAAGIGAVFASNPDLVLEAEWRSGIYRIQRFRCRSEGSTELAPAIIDIPYADPPPGVAARLWVDGQSAALPGLGTVPVLAYHRLSEGEAGSQNRYHLAPAAFEAQLQWLHDNGYKTLTLEAFRACVWDGVPCPDQSVLITFDDGYRDTFEIAVPLLERYGMSATIFLPTAYVGGRAEWDAPFGTPPPLMGWDDVRAARERGIDFALHGAAHLPLTGLNAGAFAEDINRARAMFTAELGYASDAIAYPYADYDEPSARALWNLGLKLAFTMDRRRWRPGDNAMTIPRIEITGDTDLAGFARILNGRGL